MNCKLCGSGYTELTYILKNARVYVCHECDFHYTRHMDPPTTEASSVTHVPPELQDYLRKQLQYNKSKFEKQVGLIKKHAKNYQKLKVLDIGFGGGLFLSLLQKDNIESYGIESDPARFLFAKNEGNIQNIYLHSIDSEFWNQNFAEFFDIITLWDVLEHVNDPKQVINSAKKLLKPGGLIIIDTPCRNTFFHQSGVLCYKLSNGSFPGFLNLMYSEHPYGHKQIFSKKDMQNLFRMVGMKIHSTEVFSELSFPPEYYLQKLFKNKWIQKILTPFVKIFALIIPVKNKMLVIASK